MHMWIFLGVASMVTDFRIRSSVFQLCEVVILGGMSAAECEDTSSSQRVLFSNECVRW